MYETKKARSSWIQSELCMYPLDHKEYHSRNQLCLSCIEGVQSTCLAHSFQHRLFG